MSNDDLRKEVLTHLRALDNRLARIEGKLDRAAGAQHGRHRSWFHPPLWKFQQYNARAMVVPRSYARERLPTQHPRLAIVTPSYNQGQYLRATIESVLAQEYPNLLYIVQDGESSDGTRGVLESYGERILWRSERDSGQAQAINRGFDGTACEIMAYLNSDDMLLPGALAYIVKVFLDRPDVDVVYGNRIYIDQDGLEIGRCILPPHDPEALKWADYVPQETIFWRRRVWDAVGPIDENFRFALDWDFILRAQAAGFKFLRLPRFLGCFRVHSEQKTAAILELGTQEMQRLRARFIGHEPTRLEIRKAIAPYLLRQLVFHWLFKLGLLKY